MGLESRDCRRMFAGATCFSIISGFCPAFKSRGCVLFISVISALSRTDNAGDWMCVQSWGVDEIGLHNPLVVFLQVVGVSCILLPSIEQWERRNPLSHLCQQLNCHQSLNCKNLYFWCKAEKKKKKNNLLSAELQVSTQGLKLNKVIVEWILKALIKAFQHFQIFILDFMW